MLWTINQTQLKIKFHAEIPSVNLKSFKMHMNKEKNEYRKLPEPIEGVTPNQLAKVIMQSPPKKEWRFMNKRQKPTSK